MPDKLKGRGYLRFILDSLNSGWLAADIKHIGQTAGICTSNIMGGDFVGDIMTALYESLTERASRMVIFSSENADYGFYVKPTSECLFSIGVDFWDWYTYLIPGNGPGEWDEKKKASMICGICSYKIVNDKRFRMQFDALTEAQVVNLAKSLLDEFARFREGNGKKYYEAHWLQNSDALCEKGIDDFPYEAYERLQTLVKQRADKNPGIDYTPDECHQDSWYKVISDWWEEYYNFREALNLNDRTAMFLDQTKEIILFDISDFFDDSDDDFEFEETRDREKGE